MANTAHSFTEGAEYTPEPDNPQPRRNSIAELHDNYLNVSIALSKFIELHDREQEGDETITQKEWTSAIKEGKKALEIENNTKQH